MASVPIAPSSPLTPKAQGSWGEKEQGEADGLVRDYEIWAPFHRLRSFPDRVKHLNEMSAHLFSGVNLPPFLGGLFYCGKSSSLADRSARASLAVGPRDFQIRHYLRCKAYEY